MTTKHTPESQWVINYLMGIQRTGRHVPMTTMLLVADSESAAISERDHLREVNAELLAALKNALNVMSGVATGDLDTIKADSNAIRQSRAAIAHAEGE